MVTYSSWFLDNLCLWGGNVTFRLSRHQFTRLQILKFESMAVQGNKGTIKPILSYRLAHYPPCVCWVCSDAHLGLTLGGCSQWGKLEAAILTPSCQSCGLIWIVSRKTWASNNHNSPADLITSAICHDLDALSLSHGCAGSWQCGTRCNT